MRFQECASARSTPVFVNDSRLLLVESTRISSVDLNSSKSQVLVEEDRGENAAVSASGQWLVTCGESGVSIWCAQSGEFVEKIPTSRRALRAGFSPTAPLLVIDTEAALHFHSTDTWQRTGSIAWDANDGHAGSDGELAFSRDGRLLVFSRANHRIELVDPFKQSRIGTLRSISAGAWVALSPDASLLACSGADMTIQLWDLRRIREQLRSMSLDW